VSGNQALPSPPRRLGRWDASLGAVRCAVSRRLRADAPAGVDATVGAGCQVLPGLRGDGAAAGRRGIARSYHARGGRKDCAAGVRGRALDKY